jgi:hypothetical protein
MLTLSFVNAGKTLVLSDLHLNTLAGAFEDLQGARIAETCSREAPDALVLNGDTFDLFFSMDNGVASPNLEVIAARNKPIVTLLQGIPKLYFLAGTHDQALRWNPELARILRTWFPNCQGFYDGLFDRESGVVVVPGSQWYYDNVVRHGEVWLSLTEDLTTAFRDFLLSGRLDGNALRRLYLDGELGFWYRTGSHYEFLRGLARAFDCQIDMYFERIASLCQSDRFAAWVERQFYEEHRVVGRLAKMQAQDGGSAMEALAPLYWRVLGRTVNERLSRYLESRVLNYPPHENVPFRVAVVGHSHLVQTLEYASRRSILFTGSTKPQTRIRPDSWIAENELGGGYAVIEYGNVRLEQFPIVVHRTDLRELATQFS